MTSARLHVHEALKPRVEAAVTTSGVDAEVTTRPAENQQWPYVVIGEDNEQDGLYRAKGSSAATIPHTIRIYAASQIDAKTIAEAVIENLTGTELVLGSGTTITATLVSAPLIAEPRPDGTFYQIPVRLRFEVGHYA